jgi:ABC-type glycerol-3-phosphate transport system substrate-binding protein
MDRTKRPRTTTRSPEPKDVGLTRRRLLQVGAAAAVVGSAGLPRLARAAAPHIGKKTSITYWTVLDHRDTKTGRSRAEAAMVDLFRKRHPDIEVNVQIVPWQQMTQQIVLAAGAGKSPDVAMASDRGLTTLVKAGAISPLNDYVGKHWTKEQKEDWLLPQNSAVFDGKQMGVYWHTNVGNLLFVNSALLKAKEAKIPRTWEEMTQTGKLLTQGRTVGYLMGASKDGSAVQLIHWLIPFLWAAGAEWLDDKGRVAFNTEAGAKPFQWLHDMVHLHKVIPEGMAAVTRDNMLDAFKSGTVAMTTLASNVVTAARGSTAGKDMILAMDPGLRPDRPDPVYCSGKWMVIGKDSKEKGAAALFIEEETSPEAQVINARLANELPSRKSALNDPWFASPEAADMKVMVEAARQYGRTMFYHERELELQTMVAEATQQIIGKRKSVKDALDDVAKTWAAKA